MSIVTHQRFTVPGVASGVAVAPPSDPALSVVAIQVSNNGGNNPWTTAGAIQSGGTAFYGWVDNNGNIEGSHFIEATSVLEGQFTIHAAFDDDAHDSPAFVRRASDGRFIVVYSKHNSTPINLRVSTNVGSFNGWGAATNLDSQLGGSRYTDYQIFERSGTLWMVYRDEPTAGTDSRWCISSCSSATPTSGWAAQTIVYRNTSTRSYLISHYDAVQDRLHFIATNGASSGFTKIGHFYRDMAAGTYHKSDGTGISLSLDFTEITEIYSGTGNVFGINMTADASGHPVVAAWDTLDYVYCRWDGAAWTSTVVTASGTGYEYGGLGTGFQPWGIAVDDGDPDVVWLLKDGDGSNPQLWKYETADGGDTFTASQVTTTLTGDNVQVICVRNPDKLRAFWMSGTWTYWDGGDWTTHLEAVRTS